MSFSGTHTNWGRNIFGHSCFIFMLFACLFLSRPVLADDRSLLYDYYMDQGVQALNDNDAESAVVYFKRARLLNPTAADPARYLTSLNTASALPENPLAGTAAAWSDGLQFQKLMAQGRAAFVNGDLEAANQYFYRAHEIAPQAGEPVENLNLIKRSREGHLGGAAPSRGLVVAKEAASSVAVVSEPSRMRVVSSALDRLASGSVTAPAFREPVPVRDNRKRALEVLSIAEIVKANPAKPILKIELNSAVIIEGRDIQRFLEIDPGIILVKAVGRDQLRIDAPKWGNMFLHIWDERGRTTIYVQVRLPDGYEPGAVAANDVLEHASPFRMTYDLDNSSYYIGPDVPHLRRQSQSIYEKVGIIGGTPYGVLDASVTGTGFGPIKAYPTYTIGLSNVPLPTTSDLDLRVFDFTRYLSPLTLGATPMRGESGEVKFFDNALAISASHGQTQSSTSFFSQYSDSETENFINAVQVALFPGSAQHYYALNFARGYGKDRNDTESSRNYSIEGRQKIKAVDLNGELARDDSSTSASAGLKWANGLLRQTVRFRDIKKDFSLVSGSVSNQGEIGGIWSTAAEWGILSTETYLDVYQNRLFPNIEHPNDLNSDAFAHVHIPIGEKYAVDVSVRYGETPGEESPHRFVSGDLRLSRFFSVWGGRSGTIYAGTNGQLSRYSFFSESEYDRYSFISGIQLPLTARMSGYLNYEYSLVKEILSRAEYQPSVMSAGISYARSLTDKLTLSAGAGYRNEMNVGGVFSFLAGEDSVTGSLGLNYAPAKDVTIFVDTELRNVLAQISDNPSYHEFNLHFGMRMAWGLGVVWDPRGTVAGYVFRDRDGNKKFSAGDEGIAGVRVKVGDKETVTDAKGYYRASVKARRVTVAPVTTTLPMGSVFVTPAFQKVSITQSALRRADFGLSSRAGIYGAAFVDKNGNNIPDVNETFLRGVRIKLDNQTVAVTDATGVYFFKDVVRGKHVLAVDINSVPVQYVPQIKLKSEVDIEEGMTHVFHIPLKPGVVLRDRE